MEYWKYRAVDRLKDYSAQRVSLINITEEIARLKSEALFIKSVTADGTPVKGGGSGREDRLLSNIVKRGELELLLERAQKAVSIVDRGLAVLTPDEKHILDVMYIIREKGYIDRLMQEYNLLEESSLYKKANKALLHFTIAMYGATES